MSSAITDELCSQLAMIWARNVDTVDDEARYQSRVACAETTCLRVVCIQQHGGLSTVRKHIASIRQDQETLQPVNVRKQSWIVSPYRLAAAGFWQHQAV